MQNEAPLPQGGGAYLAETHRAGEIQHGAGLEAFYLAVRTPVVSTAVISDVAIFSMCHET